MSEVRALTAAIQRPRIKIRPATSIEGAHNGKGSECGDVVPGCKEEIKGDSEHDVLRKAAEHAKTVHNMDSIPPDVLSKVKGAIHDQGEPRTQKAGSSS